MKTRVFVVSALALALICATPRAVAAPSSGCASVTISIVTGTETVAPGTTIGIAGRITNCSSQRERYTLGVSSMSSCGQRESIATSRIALRPGETTIWTVSYPVPANTCAGSWEASVNVNDGSGSQARELSGSTTSASTIITIQ